ncbi:hypothetical protein QA802_04015 [Streptomyces sp. B21-105]|uniref:hypothetical protein n=1 Tax=Streptomyces sp. B21-105 TaxID=3039417 RepID=UPI002FF05F3D
MSAATCFVIISNTVDDAFEDLVLGLRAFCPEADIAWYNSGTRRDTPFGLRRVSCDRPLKYMKITPCFFDIFEWSISQNYDQVINLETDMVFIRPGFLEFIAQQMKEVDYVAPGLRRNIPPVSLWPAYRTLSSERAELSAILGTDHLNRCFSPSQIFGRGYVSALLSSGNYARIRSFVERNQQPGRSWTLQELILPSLADSVGATSRPYPLRMATFNRYRPFQAPIDLEIAQTVSDAFFLHPVRRAGDDPVRRHARNLAHRALTESGQPAETN